MTDKQNLFRRGLSLLLSAVLLLSLFPLPAVTLRASAEEGLTRYADPATLDGWREYYYRGPDNFDTANAGGIWNDKSVLTSADALEAIGVTGVSDPSERGFLSVLSTIGSNMTITGESAVATDTVLVLDTSGSMNTSAVEAMLEAANISIQTLMDANPNNRVAVVFYANTTTTFLPLDHYTTRNEGVYLLLNNSSRIDLDSTVRNSSNQDPNPSTRSVTGGTYMAKGFQQVRTVFNNVGLSDTSVSRKPVIMFMTDGSPTRADTDFTNPPSHEGRNSNDLGNGTGTNERIVFATELAAAYTKETVSKKYMDVYGPSGECLFYTLGMISNDTNTTYRECVLDPLKYNTQGVKDMWQLYYDAPYGESFRYTTVGDATNITKLDEGDVELNEDYVDMYMAAATEADLVGVFEKVLADISLHTIYYPTLVEDGDSNLSGYISYVDKMGRYMDAIGIRGLIINNELYTGAHMAHAFVSGELGTVQSPTDLGDNLIWSIKQRLAIDADTARSLVASAYSAGQLYYNSDTDFSNYFGWYSDANNKFLGFYAEGTTVPANAAYVNKSYLFLGELDPTTSLRDSQMMYATVRIREEIATGEDEVDFAIPASLVPTITYSVDLDVSGNVENITCNAEQVSPIRLVYETKLDNSINKWTAGEVVADSYKHYLSEYGNSYTMNDDGSINFYNNKWSFDGLEGYGTLNPYSYYHPSYENNRHYYQEDVVFYVASGSGYQKYQGVKPVAGDGNTYYYGATVYAKTGADSFEKKTVYEALQDEVLPAARQNDNGWFIPAKYIRRGYVDYKQFKSDNTTDTLKYAVSPYSYYSEGSAQAGVEGHYSIVGATLGNNGRIILNAETGVKITKQVESGVNAGDKEFTFTVTNESLKSVTCEALKVNANGLGTDTTVSFNGSGIATVYLKAGESIYIGDMAEGQTVTVKETGEVDYLVTALTVDGVADEDTVATIVLEQTDMPEAVFTNGARGKGAITVSKRITHPYGASYAIPADKPFPITLTFTLDGAPLANYTLGSGYATDVNGKLTFDLTHSSSRLIDGIPMGTVVQVTETAPAGFTPIYNETVGTANDGIVTVSATTATVAIVNSYKPTPASAADIQVSGIKRFDQEGHAREWTVGDSFTFMLQEYKNGWATIEHENAVQTITIKEGDGYVGTTKDYPFNFTSVFQDVVYTTPGTYLYRVAEQGGTIPGVSYDNTTHRFQVTVSDDNMSGTLKITKVESLAASVTVSGSYHVTATFINDYNPTSVVVNFQLQKTVQNLSGSPLATQEGFRYLLAQVESFSDAVDWSTATDMGTTSSTGVIRFPVTLDQAGTYYYKVKEFIPDRVPAGWTYTEIVHNVIVEVSNDYGSAGFVARAYLENAAYADEISSTVILPFENIYAPGGDEIILVDHEPTDLTPDFIRKNLTGRAMEAGEFTFVIYDEDNGTVYTTGTNEAAAAGENVAVNFAKNLVFDTVGEFNYSVYEKKTDKAGVTYDEHVYHFTVVVTDTGEGYLEAVLTVNDGVDSHNVVNFVNSYKAENIPYSLTGSKQLSGKDLTANAFGFNIQPCNENGNVLPGTAPALVYNDENGTISFPQVTYSAAGVYHYLVWENIPSSDNTLGISYDKTRYIATVTVTDNTDEGKLEAAVSYQVLAPDASEWQATDTGILFDNSYSAAPASVTFLGSKTMEGMELTASWSFSLYQSNAAWDRIGNALDTKINGAPDESNTGTFSFKPQSFDSVGTYYFVAVENIPTEKQKGVTFDETEYRITVTVTDNGRGQLIAETHIFTDSNTPSDSLEFVNVYAPVEGTSVTFFGNKTLETGDGTDVDFTDFTFSFELYEADEGFVYSGTPTSVDAGVDGKFSFLTQYKPEDLGKSFYYVVVETDYGVGGMTYSTQEYHITVEVLDTVKDGVLETAVTITDKDGKAVDSDKIDFINNYAIVETTSFDISGKKYLTGRDIKVEEFIFDLYPSDAQGTVTGTPIKSVYCGTDGLFSITGIPLTAAGTHYFVVKENTAATIPGVIYDTTSYLITVVVNDNKDGTLKVAGITCERMEDAANVAVETPEFRNVYSASATAPLSLSANKTLTGRDMLAGEFIFEIYDEDNKTVFTTGTNKAATAGTTAAITFQKDFVFNKAGVYHFSVYEKTPTAPGVTKDPNKYYFTVTVTDNTEEGILEAVLELTGSSTNTVSFTNSYKAAPVPYTVTGIKELEGQALTPNTFSFGIQPCDENGTPLSGTQAIPVQNGEAGAITFPEVTYTQAGIYHYLVWEIIPDGEKYGITYDETKYIATVTVTDNTETGELEANITYQIQLPGESIWTNTDSGILFGNKYHASSTYVILGGTKTVTGKSFAANDYEFELYVSDAAWTLPEAAEQTKSNGAPNAENVAAFTFDKLSYNEIGTHYYIVKENIPDELPKGMTYDETVYYITVNVNDNGKGLLVPEIVINGGSADSVAFVNKYAVVEGTSVTVNGEKNLDTGAGTDAGLTDFTFSFELYQADSSFAPSGEPTVAHAGTDGKYSFTMDYVPADLDNTFYYVIVEKDYGVGGMTYSQAAYHITVKVLDTVKDGVLETEVTVTDKDGNPVAADKVDFNNNYAITEYAKFSIKGDKVLTGRNIKANEFKFDLYTSDGLVKLGTEPMTYVYCGTDGKFTIADIELNTAGTHYFILTEDGQIAKPGVSYDKTEYLITVTVMDNKDGTLSVSNTEYARMDAQGNVVVEKLEFHNSYAPGPSSPLYFSGTKLLNGRDLIDGEFTFILQATDSQFNPLDTAPITAVNGTNGIFTFDSLKYYYAGTYYYVISEDASLDISRVTYDDAVYYVTVNVWDDTANGKLVAEYSIKTAPDGEVTTEPIQFTNTYTPKPDDITVDLDITKTVVNKGSTSITGEGFQFLLELIGLEGGITATSDADGKAKFTLTFTEDNIGNTYSFKLTEINDGAAHVTYSPVEYAIDISITLDENNKLVATIVQDTVAVEQVAVEFINEYDYTPLPPDGPSTGDNTSIHLWLSILALSIGAILTLAVSGKKKEEEI